MIKFSERVPLLPALRLQEGHLRHVRPQDHQDQGLPPDLSLDRHRDHHRDHHQDHQLDRQPDHCLHHQAGQKVGPELDETGEREDFVIR